VANDTEQISTVLNNYFTDDGDAFDNIYNKHAFMRYLFEKDLEGNGEFQRVNKSSGGKQIEHPLEIAEGGITATYDGLDEIQFGTVDTMSNTQWEWKNLVSTLTLDKKKIIERKGQASILADYVATKLKNVQKSIRSETSRLLFATTVGAKDFDSIPTIVVKDPTASATVGGINGNTAATAYWRNRTQDSGTAIGGNAVTTYEDLIKAMTSLALTQGQNAADDMPDLALTDQIVYEYILFWFQAKGQFFFTDNQMSKAVGFEVPIVRGMNVVTDVLVPDMKDSGAATSSVFQLNTEYLRFTVEEERQFTVEGKLDLMHRGQDAWGWPIMLRGNFTCSNRDKQGLLWGIPRTLAS